MKYPTFLKKGDKIVITALSKGVKKNDVERKTRYFIYESFSTWFKTW